MPDLEWFPLYVHRFLNSRRLRRMDATKIGIYTLLMCEQWEGGPIPDNDVELMFLARCSASDARAVLGMCFELTPEGWLCPEVEKIRAEQAEKRQRYVEAGRLGGQAKAKNRPSDALPEKPSNALQEEESRIEKSKRRIEKKKETTPPNPPYENEFSLFWEMYPKKIGKADALEKYQTRRRQGVAHESLMGGLGRYLKWTTATDTILKHPATFLGPKKWWAEPWTITEAMTAKEETSRPPEDDLPPYWKPTAGDGVPIMKPRVPHNAGGAKAGNVQIELPGREAP